MEFDAVLLAPRRARMVEQGFWHDRTINERSEEHTSELQSH